MKSALDIVEFLKPKPCPFLLVRIGGKFDGAYLVPDDLNGITACYSPGTSNRKDFDDELQDKFGIASHMCNFSSDLEKFKTPLKEGQTFRKKWLSTQDDDENITLSSWIEQENPAASDLLLQMDLEGAEYKTINETPGDALKRFRVITMELHSLGRLNKHKSLQFMIPFFKKLSQHHQCIHLHPNNCANQVQVGNSGYWIPRVLEITLLRKDRFAVTNELIPPQLPHPLNIEYNVRRKQPQVMGRNWSR